MSAAARFGSGRLELGRPRAPRMLEDRTGDFEDIARQALEHGLGG